MKEKNRQKRLRLLAEAKKKPAVFTVYIILRLVVVAILVSSILRGEYENAISICQQAINMGFDNDKTKGGMQGRIARLCKKANLNLLDYLDMSKIWFIAYRLESEEEKHGKSAK